MIDNNGNMLAIGIQTEGENFKADMQAARHYSPLRFHGK